MQTGAAAPVRTRVGVVGAYVGGADVALVRRVRELAGRVTVSGKSGLRLVTSLAQAGDLDNVDLDPAGYLKPQGPQLELLPEDWTALQRSFGLSVVRSQGRYVPARDHASLHAAMSERVGPGVVRVVSLHESWLRPACFPDLKDAVRCCDDDLAFVFASVMDPLGSRPAVEALSELIELGALGGRRVELLRTDLAALAAATRGAALGAIGLTTSGRHHGLGLPKRQTESWRQRQQWPLVFVPQLASWHRGSTVGALSPYDGCGLTNCPCSPCAGRSLLRFDRSWPTRVPDEVSADARIHDVAAWSALATRVLAASDPAASWSQTCIAAATLADEIAIRYKVVIDVPTSIKQWSRSGG